MTHLEKIVRKNYSKIPALVEIPNLLDVQLESYKNFIMSAGKDKPGESLQSVFETIFPIVSARENFVLEFISHLLRPFSLAVRLFANMTAGHMVILVFISMIFMFQGIFARIFMEHYPLLPAEDEGRLYDPKLRENFIERIFTLKRWREVLASKESRGSLIDFHTRHKLLILSHSPRHYQMMGKLVAKAKDISLKERYQQYQKILMEALQLKTTPKKNANVLMHMMGYFKEQLTSDEKQELLEVLDQYRQEYIPLVVPTTLINHYVRKYDQTYLKRQVYLNPHPVELQLRNHV